VRSRHATIDNHRQSTPAESRSSCKNSHHLKPACSGACRCDPTRIRQGVSLATPPRVESPSTHLLTFGLRYGILRNAQFFVSERLPQQLTVVLPVRRHPLLGRSVPVAFQSANTSISISSPHTNTLDLSIVEFVISANAQVLTGRVDELPTNERAAWQRTLLLVSSRLNDAQIVLAYAPPTCTRKDPLLLTPAEAAARIGCTRGWLYRHSRTLPFAVKVSRRMLRFSPSKLERWLAAREGGAAR
jgi:predicted DNA-binding transcriptional regulator AlpA